MDNQEFWTLRAEGFREEAMKCMAVDAAHAALCIAIAAAAADAAGADRHHDPACDSESPESKQFRRLMSVYWRD